MGRGARSQGPKVPHQYLQYLKSVWIWANIFCRGTNSLTKNKTKMSGKFLDHDAAHLRTEVVEIRPEGPISGLRGLITGLRVQPGPGVFLCRRGPVPGLRESNGSIERAYSRLNPPLAGGRITPPPSSELSKQLKNECRYRRKT